MNQSDRDLTLGDGAVSSEVSSALLSGKKPPKRKTVIYEGEVDVFPHISLTYGFLEGRAIYEWEQDLDEVHIFIKPPAGVKAKDISCSIKSRHLTLGLKGNPPFMNVKKVFCVRII